MKNANKLITSVLVCMVLFGASYVFAQDWCQWRGMNRDGKVSGFTEPEEWPKELTQKWKATVGSGDATPALVGEKLYVFSRQDADEVTVCLNASDGKEIWQNKYAAQEVTGAAGRHPGPRSSPTVAEGKVVTLGVGGVLSCLDAATGKEVWRNEEFSGSVPKFFTSMSPIIVDGMCIAHLGEQDNGAIIAFDLATGNEKWRWTGDGPAYASPVLMTVEDIKQVVVQTEKSVIGLAVTDGKVLWQVESAAEGRFYNSATPIVDGQTVIYTGQGQGTKAVEIEKQEDGFVVKELWSNVELGTGFNTPVLKDNLLFGLSNSGNLFCLNAQTGQTAWADTAEQGKFGSILDAGTVIFALPDSAELIAFKPDGKEYSEIKRYKVSETKIYAHPIVSGNRVFVKDQDSLAMWAVE
jgi:outer membrane protein assembly factor BamB